ncbi:MAG: hypothetical protein IPM29_04075 [Planctomycetes bacterium]|nr:hypothetical protein [Planctomycetota bacterium]
MRSLYTLAAIAALSTLANAQLQSLTTTFTSNNGGAAEWMNMFDLTVLSPVGITIPWVDVNVFETTTGTIDLYVQPGGTYVGNQTNPAAWPATPTASSLPFVGQGLDVPTNAVLQSAIYLPQGSYAVAIHYRAVSPAYTNGNGVPGNQQVADANLRLDLGSATSGLFSGSVFNPRVCNIAVYYGVGNVTFASASTFGSGCAGVALGDATFYELFDGATSTFDLSNTGFTLNWTGNGYAFNRGASAIFPPTGAGPQFFGDDDTQPIALPFTMPCAAGFIDTVYLCSNGFLSFEPTTDTSYIEDVLDLLAGPTRLAFLWHDLNPSAGGTIDAEFDNNGVFHITFTGVPEFGLANSNDVQISLQSNGTIEVKYGSVALLGALVGLSTGNGATDPGGIDLSAASPFLLATGFARADLGLEVVDRPVLGTTAGVRVTGIAGNSLAGALNFGVQVPTPIDLTPLGAPGCAIRVGPLFSLGFPVGSATAPIGIMLPNNPAFVGVVLDQQAAVANLGYNALGVATSNGLRWTLDVN